jgi:hypothetical protein
MSGHIRKILIFAVPVVFLTSVFCLIFYSLAGAGEIPRLILHENENAPLTATVYTTGIGYLPSSDTLNAEAAKEMAKRAALTDGFRNLVAMLQGARRYLTQDGAEVFSVEGYLNNVEVVETRYLQDGSVEVDLMMTINVYDASIAKEKTLLDYLSGKGASALKGIAVVETDTDRQKVTPPSEIVQEITAADKE